MLAGGAGGAIAVGAMEFLPAQTAFPLMAIPFATSIVTVLGSSRAKPAQPRALIGGHLVSTIVGLLVASFFGNSPWTGALAVGLAIIAMHVTDTYHPPAGIDPLVIVVNELSWSFLIAPVAIGAASLALFAFAWHGVTAYWLQTGITWPKRRHDGSDASCAGLTDQQWQRLQRRMPFLSKIRSFFALREIHTIPVQNSRNRHRSRKSPVSPARQVRITLRADISVGPVHDLATVCTCPRVLQSLVLCMP